MSAPPGVDRWPTPTPFELFLRVSSGSCPTTVSAATFRNAFEVPITRGREHNCSEEDRELSESRSRALAKISASFMLRRTANLNRKHLPSKVESVVFCPLTPAQQAVYQAVLRSKEVTGITADHMRAAGMDEDGRGQSAAALACLTILKKLCTHPGLVAKDLRRYEIQCDDGLLDECAAAIGAPPAAMDQGNFGDGHKEGGEDAIPESHPGLLAQSGKLMVLAHLIRLVCRGWGHKMVIVSNYTESLDLVQRVCDQEQVGTLRLDGSTPGHKRQSLVNRFNSKAPTDERAFLLSAKAGGVGLVGFWLRYF